MPLKCTRRRRQLASPAPAVRLHKAADAEVAKHRRHRHRNQKATMRVVVRSRLTQRRLHLPRSRGSEHSENPEKNPGQFQPQRARHLHQRPPDRLAKAPAALLQAPSRLSHLRRSSSGLLPQPCSGGLSFARSRSRTRVGSWNRTRSLFRLYLRGRVRRRRRIHGSHQRLGRCTGPDTKRTTKSNRIHTSKCSRSRHTRKRVPHQASNEPQLRRIYTPQEPEQGER